MMFQDQMSNSQYGHIHDESARSRWLFFKITANEVTFIHLVHHFIFQRRSRSCPYGNFMWIFKMMHHLLITHFFFYWFGFRYLLEELSLMPCFDWLNHPVDHDQWLMDIIYQSVHKTFLLLKSIIGKINHIDAISLLA